MFRDHLLLAYQFHILLLPDYMNLSLCINQYNIGTQGNELHPLGHVIGPDAFDDELIPFL
jgi:hypothetical protein